MNVRKNVRLFLVVAAALVVPALLPAAGALAGEKEYDVSVSARVEWHSTWRYWEVGEPGVTSAAPSRLVNYEALLKNTLFLGASDAKPMRFTLEEDGRVVDTIEQQTPRGGRLGTEEFVHVVFRRVPPGEYLIRAQILDEDHTILSEAANVVSIGGA